MDNERTRCCQLPWPDDVRVSPAWLRRATRAAGGQRRFDLKFGAREQRIGQWIRDAISRRKSYAVIACVHQCGPSFVYLS